MDANIIHALPREPPEPQPALCPADKPLGGSPEPMVDTPEMLRTLHVNTVLNRQHLGGVHPALQPPPRDNVTHLMRLQEAEDHLGLELAVPS